MRRHFAITAVCLACIASAHAQPAERSIHVLLSVGYTRGGSTIETTSPPNNIDTPTTLQAGRGFIVRVGAEASIGERLWLQGTFGTHVGGPLPFQISGATFVRYPLDVLVHYALTDKVRIGSGAQWVTRAKVTEAAEFGGATRNFGSTIGLVLEGEYRFRPWFGVTLRGVAEQFKEQGTNQSFGANHVGLLASFYY